MSSFVDIVAPNSSAAVAAEEKKDVRPPSMALHMASSLKSAPKKPSELFASKPETHVGESDEEEAGMHEWGVTKAYSVLTSSDDVLLLLLLLLLRHDVEDVFFRPHFTLAFALHAPDDLLDVLLLLRAKSLPTPTLQVIRDRDDDGRGIHVASSSC